MDDIIIATESDKLDKFSEEEEKVKDLDKKYL